MLPRSLRELLSGVIDYAGIYPPAQLPFEESLKNYVDYQSAEFGWMVGQFVCPVGKLADLRALVSVYENWDDMPLALIGSGGSSPADLATKCRVDYGEFSRLADHRWRAISYEVRIDAELARHPDVTESIREAAHDSPAQVVFCEVPILELSREETEAAIRNVAAVESCAVKFRLGGPSAHDFPATETLAYAIERAAIEGTAMKFTAGLHHPFYHRDDSLSTRVHGFLNVFCASVLATTHLLEAQTIEAILMESDPSAFTFSDDALKVGSISANISQIESGRTFAVSFGSCSVREPVDDLVALGYEFE